MNIKIKRVYEKPVQQDGFRILVDRLWPRGLTKEKVAVDLWLKDIAPSAELRKWLSHDPDKWNEFKKRYFDELQKNKDAVTVLKDHLKKKTVTLVYAAKDSDHNEALVLIDIFEKEKL